MERMKKILKNKLVVGGVVLVALILLIIVVRWNKKPPASYATVRRGQITQEVLVTGTVKPRKQADLSFDRNGRVVWINKKVGESVSTGDILMTLENGSEQAAVDDAKAKLQSAEASLQSVKKGSRIEDIRVTESELQKAKQDLINYYGSAAQVINDAYNKSDDAVTTQTDIFFTGGGSQNPVLIFSTADQQNKNSAKDARVTVGNALLHFRTLNSNLLTGTPTNDDLLQYLNATAGMLSQVQSYLIKIGAIVSDAINLSDSTVTGYKTNISTGRTNINTALKSVNSLIQAIAAQKETVDTTARQLDLKKAGPTDEEIQQAESAADSARANLKSAQATLGRTILRSPIDGIVSRIDPEVGEIVSANSPVAAVLNQAGFKIEAQLPEADLPKVKVGDKATFTLDSYGNDLVLSAVIIAIEPAEKVIDGVSTYKITAEPKNAADKIRSGMTANLTIETATKENVLVLPQRAIINKDGARMVRLTLDSGTTTERRVETGLRGSDGNIEITSGLSEGERVINYIK
jgi:RND family efflux transporter MFP subunit